MKDFPEADPANPIRWLTHIYEDGEWVPDSAGHDQVTTEMSIELTKQQFESTYQYVSELETNGSLSDYGLTGKQCTSTAADIAAKAGVRLDPFVTLSFPSSSSVGGATLRLWTNSAYSTLRFALPDKMEQELKNWKGINHHVVK